MEENREEQSQDKIEIIKTQLCGCMEDASDKMKQMYEKINTGIDETFHKTAKKLDSAAEKIHGTADFIRTKNSSALKDDIVHLVKHHPLKALGVTLLCGFLAGKILSR